VLQYTIQDPTLSAAVLFSAYKRLRPHYYYWLKSMKMCVIWLTALQRSATYTAQRINEPDFSFQKIQKVNNITHLDSFIVVANCDSLFY